MAFNRQVPSLMLTAQFMISKRFLFSLLICAFMQIGSVFFSGKALAQNTSEVGVGLGAANYKGEVAPNYNLLKNRPALKLFYRKDISAPITLRGALMLGMIRARDSDLDLPLHQHRRAEVTTNLAELSAAMEYNFLDYYDVKRIVRWTPYFMIGAAVANYNNRVDFPGGVIKPFANTFVFAIPVGIGVKYALSNNWNLGVEFGARKTFSDRIDYFNARAEAALIPEDLPYTNPYDKDWYYYNGVSLSYTFYKIRCPEDKSSGRKRFILF
jgi:opacity protein-like surface antigen